MVHSGSFYSKKESSWQPQSRQFSIGSACIPALSKCKGRADARMMDKHEPQLAPNYVTDVFQIIAPDFAI